MARAPRIVGEQAERRRRNIGNIDRLQSLTLAIPDHVRDDNPGYKFRWINDTGNRMHAKTVLDDWDKIDGVAPIPVGTDASGRPMYTHLCRKPEDFFEEDQRAKMDDLAQQEAGLMRSARTSPDDNRPEAVSYVPDGNRITRGT